MCTWIILMLTFLATSSFTVAQPVLESLKAGKVVEFKWRRQILSKGDLLSSKILHPRYLDELKKEESDFRTNLSLILTSNNEVEVQLTNTVWAIKHGTGPIKLKMADLWSVSPQVTEN